MEKIVTTYTRVKQIGDPGGQADVWLARDPGGHQVVLKFLRVSKAASDADSEQRARFAREVKCMRSLQHPGIMPILAANLEADQPFFVMPLAESSLRTVIETHSGGLPEDDCIAYFQQLIDAMSFAHDEGIIHRDLKPENILICPTWHDTVELKIADFGLGRRFVEGTATLTQTNVGLGTIGYSAPEQFTSAHTADERADIYALGCILYELLVGKPLFHTQNVDLAPVKFRYIIHHATKRDAAERYESMADLAREFSLLSNTNSLQAPAEHARHLNERILSGDIQAIDQLIRVFIDGADDLGLYMEIFTTLPAPVLTQLALRQAEFRSIVSTYCDYAAGSHPFSFTDRLADALEATYNASADIEVRELVLDRLLVLGYEHNRWYVRERFVRAAHDSMRNGQTQVLLRTLRANPEAVDFVRDRLLEGSIPQVVKDVLAA